jgi:hypothetical protein
MSKHQHHYSRENGGCLVDGALGIKISLNIDDATVFEILNRNEA